MSPKFCRGELVDFAGSDMLPPEVEVEIVDSSFCHKGETVFDTKNNPRLIREDGWWYKHRGADLYSPENRYRKRPDKRVKFSEIFRGVEA